MATRKQAAARAEMEEMFLNGDHNTRGLIIAALVEVQSRDLLALKRWDKHHREMAAQLVELADGARCEPWRERLTNIDGLRARLAAVAAKQRKPADDEPVVDMDVWGEALAGLEF